jgi:hypothetical protein
MATAIVEFVVLASWWLARPVWLAALAILIGVPSALYVLMVILCV